jgi:hypothetical protein
MKSHLTGDTPLLSPRDALLNAMTASITCAERCSGDLRAWGSALRDSAGRIAAVTRRLWSTGDPETAPANSTAYLDSVGHVMLAWIWLEHLLASPDRSMRELSESWF